MYHAAQNIMVPMDKASFAKAMKVCSKEHHTDLTTMFFWQNLYRAWKNEGYSDDMCHNLACQYQLPKEIKGDFDEELYGHVNEFI